MKKPEALSKLRRRIAAQAEYRCGYCLTSERLSGIPLTLDHLIPWAAGGLTVESNLWMACRPCNEFKGTQTHAVDPLTHRVVPLFNPRTQTWREHFAWSAEGTHMIGQTLIGRATVEALRLNHDLIVYARRRWVKVGWHPPEQ